ncbi:MAG: hypothetical protein ABIS46_04145 [Sphingomicrobium sp.]
MHPLRTSPAPQRPFARRRSPRVLPGRIPRVGSRPIPHHALRRFGRGPARVHAIALPAPQAALGENLKLFATTYAAAFLFVTCLIA